MQISDYKKSNPLSAYSRKDNKETKSSLNINDTVQLGSQDIPENLSLQKKLEEAKRNIQNVSEDSPFQSKPKIEHEGKLVKIIQEIDPKTSIEGLNELVEKGTILSYSLGKKELIIYGNSENVVDELKKLKISKNSNKGGGIISKLKEIFIPPDLDENCAPEYLRYRMWSLGAAVCGGAIGFMTARVNLDAVKVAFSSTEKAALSGVINGMITKFTSMGGSFLAKKGDADPKKFMLTSSLIASFNSLLTLGLLCTVPTSLPVLAAFTALTGALAGTLGSAAGVNIFNHMAKGPTKGLVGSKNANQDMIADMCGMPFAMLLTRCASMLGVNPYLFIVGTLGPLLAVCTVKAASSIRMDTLNQANIEKIADNYIQKGTLPEAEDKGVLKTVKSLFSGDSNDYSKRIEFPDSLEEVVGKGEEAKNSEKLFSIFKNENYILNCKGKDKVSIVFKNKATIDDIFKAYIHARLIEKGIDSGLLTQLEKLHGDQGSTSLIDLAYRALPPNMRFADDLSAKGWNSAMAKLDMKKLNIDWTGPNNTTGPNINIKKFLEFTENPSLLNGDFS